MKILQYGEGNFLRTFVDAYFDALNKNGVGRYEVMDFSKVIVLVKVIVGDNGRA